MLVVTSCIVSNLNHNNVFRINAMLGSSCIFGTVLEEYMEYNLEITYAACSVKDELEFYIELVDILTCD